jgi:hypothetical protein
VVSTTRPWRAAAYWPLPDGGRFYHGSAAAKTRAGLDRYVTAAEAIGFSVDVWEVLPLPSPLVILDDPGGTQRADSSAG